jgi:transposase-like protein
MGKVQKRRTFTPEEKVALLRRHFLEKVPVSDLCEQAGIHPTLFYNWQKQFFEGGTAAFERRSPAPDKGREAEEKIAALEEKLARKNEVVAELMEEHIALKKRLTGES